MKCHKENRGIFVSDKALIAVHSGPMGKMSDAGRRKNNRFYGDILY
jgi:hypothetical protein